MKGLLFWVEFQGSKEILMNNSHFRVKYARIFTQIRPLVKITPIEQVLVIFLEELR